MSTAPQRPRVICPVCGYEAGITYTRYGVRAQCCGMWSWEGKPLADARTHAARIAAHEAFDVLWRKEGWRRSYCYSLLSDALRIPKEDCHMSLMPAEIAERVPAAVETIRVRLLNATPKIRQRHFQGTRSCSSSSSAPSSAHASSSRSAPASSRAGN